MTDNEKLIEEAERAIKDLVLASHETNSRRDDAEFLRGHIRQALSPIRAALGAVLSSALRRPDEPEAEEEIEPEICKGCDEYDPLALCMAANPEPQGEPSDAQYPEVNAFADRMRAEMIANAHKGDQWQRMTPREAWGEISWHLGKLTAALKAEDVPAIRELAADIANGAMMLDQIVSVYESPAPAGNA